MSGSSPESARVHVLFIMGFRQSGTTLLSSLLGGIPGFLNLGEAHNVWGQKSRGWPKCGCGAAVDGCSFWEPVLKRTLEKVGLPPMSAPPDRQVLETARDAWVKTWRRSLLVGWRSPHDPGGIAYGQVMARLYHESAGGGAPVLIDASKKPAYAALLEGMDGVSVHLLHVARDPRACLWSQLRRRADVAPPRAGPLVTGRFAASWTAVNLMSETVRRGHRTGATLFLRYEDFIAEPEKTLREVCQAVGVEPRSLPLDGSHTAIMPSGHSASGNARVRFRAGRVELQLDDTWKTSLPTSARRTVTTLTSPMLARYGYALAPL